MIIIPIQLLIREAKAERKNSHPVLLQLRQDLNYILADLGDIKEKMQFTVIWMTTVVSLCLLLRVQEEHSEDQHSIIEEEDNWLRGRISNQVVDKCHQKGRDRLYILTLVKY